MGTYNLSKQDLLDKICELLDNIEGDFEIEALKQAFDDALVLEKQWRMAEIKKKQ